MTKQSENQETKEPKDKTEADAATEERINQIADKAATKAIKTEQLYDKGNPIFSK